MILLIPFAFAAIPAGGTVDLGVSSSANSSSIEQANTTAGNVTVVNLTSVAITTRWSAFFGNLSGEILLGDGDGNSLFKWTLSNMTDSVVYAANNTIDNWSTLVAANVSDMPSYLQTSTTDNYTNTFVNNEVHSFANLPIDAEYATTWQNGAQGSLKTYALKTDNARVFAAVAIDDADSFRAGETVDYQLLLPANALVTYNFYLELN